MTPLATKIVFLTSSTLGAASLGGTAYVVEHPRAFAPELARPLAVNIVPERPMPPAPVVIPQTIELSPMVVTGSKAPLIPHERAARPAKAKTFVPCSDWRDMGPTNVNKGNATGVRKVRKLC
ncbi:MAG TPA: hypothetical protein VF103_12395 [Polyangiaceae bacterium]